GRACGRCVPIGPGSLGLAFSHRHLRFQGWAKAAVQLYCRIVRTSAWANSASHGPIARVGVRRATLAVALAALLAAPAARAQERDSAAVGKITLLNRKAVDAYQHLEFETAMRILNEALDHSER